jgi:carboxypeptidase C (cathepsin A)
VGSAPRPPSTGRAVIADNIHSPAAPYTIVNNDQRLLDASDLVFVEVPGTGFSRVSGKDNAKAFYGVDADAYAFAEFVTGFLPKYARLMRGSGSVAALQDRAAGGR